MENKVKSAMIPRLPPEENCPMDNVWWAASRQPRISNGNVGTSVALAQLNELKELKKILPLIQVQLPGKGRISEFSAYSTVRDPCKEAPPLMQFPVVATNEEYAQYLQAAIREFTKSTNTGDLPEQMEELLSVVLTLGMTSYRKTPSPDTLKIRRRQKAVLWKLGEQWKDLAASIGFSSSEIDLISEFVQENPKSMPFFGVVQIVLDHWQRCSNMFETERRADEAPRSRRFKPCTKEVLAENLKEIGRKDLYEQFMMLECFCNDTCQ